MTALLALLSALKSRVVQYWLVAMAASLFVLRIILLAVTAGRQAEKFAQMKEQANAQKELDASRADLDARTDEYIRDRLRDRWKR